MQGLATAARERVVALGLARVALTVATAAFGQTAGAAPGDPLQSTECQHALAALNGEETAVAEASRASGGVTANDRRLIDARLAPARRLAGRACLTRSADPATLSTQRLTRLSPIAAGPIAVAPLATAPSSGPVHPGTTRAPLAAPTPPTDKPYAITSCDAGGCWANDGSRLNRVGPSLWGPRGACTVQGSLVQCP